MKKKFCSIEVCPNQSRTKGWCNKHYQQWRKTGDPLYRYTKPICSEQGCGKVAKCKGLCAAHYKHARSLVYKYGITKEIYDKMLADQNGLCGICGADKADIKKLVFDVDHDHKTEKVRGLLCSACNMALGLFGDRVDSLLKAIEWLGRDWNVE